MQAKYYPNADRYIVLCAKDNLGEIVRPWKNHVDVIYVYKMDPSDGPANWFTDLRFYRKHYTHLCSLAMAHRSNGIFTYAFKAYSQLGLYKDTTEDDAKNMLKAFYAGPCYKQAMASKRQAAEEVSKLEHDRKVCNQKVEDYNSKIGRIDNRLATQYGITQAQTQFDNGNTSNAANSQIKGSADEI